MSIDLGYAAWLKGDELKLVAASPTAARWPTQGVTAEAPSPFGTAAGAQAEADRRIALFSAPRVVDRAVVPGERRDLIGRCVTLRGDQLGYSAGIVVLVIGVAEQDNGTTILTVLRRLG